MKWLSWLKRNKHVTTENKEKVEQPIDFKSHFSFSEDGKSVSVTGIPELEKFGNGEDCGEGIVCFRGRNRNDSTYILVNINTGKMRKLCASNGDVLVGNSEMDYEAIDKKLEYPMYAHHKSACSLFGLNSRFEKGLGMIQWRTHDDEGMSTMDEDGYGMTRDWDEDIYCVINTDFEIVLPFTPIFPLRVAGILDYMRNKQDETA